jgi:acyl-coenzyme A synthetase/AMP-(fatty) acid ligase
MLAPRGDGKVSSNGIALVEGEDRVTFHELHQRVLPATSLLKEKWVGKGDCVYSALSGPMA